MGIIPFVFNFLLITILGLLIAFSPMIVIVNAIVVLKSSKPILRTLVLMAGMAAPLLLMVWLTNLLLHSGSQISLGGARAIIQIPPLINLIFGVWILLLGWRRWQYARIHGGPKKSVNLIIEHPPDNISGLFIFAFLKSALSVTNLVAILLLCKILFTKQIQGPLALLAIIWVIMIGLFPLGLIMYYNFFKHEMVEQLSAQVDRLLNRNVDAAVNLVLIGVGGFFAMMGIAHLLSS